MSPSDKFTAGILAAAAKDTGDFLMSMGIGLLPESRQEEIWLLTLKSISFDIEVIRDLNKGYGSENDAMTEPMLRFESKMRLLIEAAEADLEEVCAKSKTEVAQ